MDYLQKPFTEEIMLAYRHLPVVLLPATVFACSPGQDSSRPSAEQDLAAIAEARGRLGTALADDDVPGIIAELAQDHLTMPSDATTPPNNEALSEWHQARIDNFRFDLKLLGPSGTAIDRSKRDELHTV